MGKETYCIERQQIERLSFEGKQSCQVANEISFILLIQQLSSHANVCERLKAFLAFVCLFLAMSGSLQLYYLVLQITYVFKSSLLQRHCYYSRELNIQLLPFLNRNLAYSSSSISLIIYRLLPKDINIIFPIKKITFQ